MSLNGQVELGPVGRLVAPLAPFIQRMKDERAELLRQGRESASEPNGTVSESAQNPINSNARGIRERDRTQCRYRRPKRRPDFETLHPRRRTTKSGSFNRFPRHDGRNGPAKNKVVLKRAWSAPTLVCDICGRDVKFTNETRCEDCFADDQNIWHGRPLRVDLNKPQDD